MRPLIFLAILLTFLSMSNYGEQVKECLPSLNPDKRISQYVFEVWTMANRLPSNSIRAFAQTSDGYLWLGTLGGLVRFDGVKFTVFNRDNTRVLRHNRINALLAGQNGGLWIGTQYDGLLHYNGKGFKKYSTTEGLPDNDILCLTENRRGELLIGSASGVTRFSRNRFTALNPHRKIPQVGALCLDKTGRLWIGSATDGLFCFEANKITAYTKADGFQGSGVTALSAGKNGEIWIATQPMGLVRYDSRGFTAQDKFNQVIRNKVNNLYVDRSGTMWIGADSGIGRLANGKFDFYSSQADLGDVRIRRFFEDREGNLWVGSYNGGLCRIKEGQITAITSTEGLSENMIWAVYEDSNGAVWLGTHSSGINCIKDGEISTYTTADGLPSNFIRCFYEDSQGTFWIGTSNGLVSFSNGRFTTYSQKEGMPRAPIRAIHEPVNEPGTLLVGCNDRGIYQFKNGLFTPLFLKGAMKTVAAYWMLQDKPNSTTWIGTSGGLIGLHGQEKRVITTADGLNMEDLVSGYIENDGTMWLGTNGGGINRFKNGVFTSYTTSDGLWNDSVWSIIEDGNRNLWMSCDRGIFRIPIKDFYQYDSGKIQSIRPYVYGTDDGMKSIECNNSSNPVLKRKKDGTLWYPTLMGTVMMDPMRVIRNVLPPPVHIEKMTFDVESVQFPVKKHIPANIRDFAFHFTALSYTNPEAITFKYKLEGFNKEWVDAGKRRSAFYTNLPPGRYRFKVIAANEEGIWNHDGTQQSFFLASHFYHTWWFITLLVLLAILLVYSLFHLRIQSIRKRNLKLQQEIKRRKQAQVETNHLRKMLKNIIDSMPSILIGVDQNGKVTNWNDEASKHIGISAEHAFGRFLDEVYPPFSKEMKMMMHAMKTREVCKNEKVAHLVEDKTIYHDITIYPLSGEGMQGAVIRIDDVTEIENKEAQFRQAQKMDTVGVLAGGLIHDFNNILGGITGTVSLTKHRLKKTGILKREKLDEFIDMMEECGDRAAKMVKQLLTLSRRQPMALAPVDLNLTIKHVISICKNSLHKSVKLEPKYMEIPAMIKADPTQMEQVLLNFCVNADHAMTIMRDKDERWGGALAVSLDRISADKHFRDKHDSAEDRDYWVLSVRDIGIGMDKETISKIFNPFFTRKPRGKGTGLGLSMAYSIIMQHNGFVDVYSRVGTGTTFNIYLPVYDDDSALLRKSHHQESVPRGEGLIMVVDDEKVMRKIAKDILEDCGYQVIFAGNGKEAVDLFQKHWQEISAILLDMAMPEMSGKEAYIEMKKIDPNLKVLLTSGYKEGQRFNETMSLGINAFIQKPFTLNKLAQAINEVIQFSNQDSG